MTQHNGECTAGKDGHEAELCHAAEQRQGSEVAEILGASGGEWTEGEGR